MDAAVQRVRAAGAGAGKVLRAGGARVGWRQTGPAAGEAFA